MVKTAVRCRLNQPPNGGGGARSPGGRSDLVTDYFELFSLPHELEHGQYEILAGRRVYPRGAQHNAILIRQDVTFAGEFGRSIYAQWIGRIVWKIGAAGSSVEDEVRGQMQQPRLCTRGGFGEGCNSPI